MKVHTKVTIMYFQRRYIVLQFDENPKPAIKGPVSHHFHFGASYFFYFQKITTQDGYKKQSFDYSFPF